MDLIVRYSEVLYAAIIMEQGVSDFRDYQRIPDVLLKAREMEMVDPIPEEHRMDVDLCVIGLILQRFYNFSDGTEQYQHLFSRLRKTYFVMVKKYEKRKNGFFTRLFRVLFKG